MRTPPVIYIDIPALRPATVGAYAFAFASTAVATALRLAIDPYIVGVFSVLKAGWFIGGSGGRGEMIFHGRRYPLTIGGLSAGLVFGASETNFVGSVSNIFRPSDVAGVYGAANAGGALVVGGGVIALTNEKGAILHFEWQAGRIDSRPGPERNGDFASLSCFAPLRNGRSALTLQT